MKVYKTDWMTAIRAIVCFTLLTGIIYPVAVTVLAKVLLPAKANGSLVLREGKAVGSQLIAQSFSQPRYFWARPSAVKYDAAASGASNQGLTSADLIKSVEERQAQGSVAEMRFASGSGLDPHISPQAARAQIGRVAEARRLNDEQKKALEVLVDKITEARQYGFLGQPTVNVLTLNLSLDEHFGK